LCGVLVGSKEWGGAGRRVFVAVRLAGVRLSPPWAQQQDKYSSRLLLQDNASIIRADLAFDREVLEICTDLAVELRNKIREKLHEMIPSEFPIRPLE